MLSFKLFWLESKYDASLNTAAILGLKETSIKGKPRKTMILILWIWIPCCEEGEREAGGGGEGRGEGGVKKVMEEEEEEVVEEKGKGRGWEGYVEDFYFKKLF